MTLSETEPTQQRTRLNWWILALGACGLNLAYEFGTSALIAANSGNDVDTGYGLGLLLTAVAAVISFVRGRRDVATSLLTGGAAAVAILIAYTLFVVLPRTY